MLLTSITMGEQGEMNGVATCYRNVLRELAALGVPVDALTWGWRDAVRRVGSANLISVRPRIRMGIGDGIHMGLEVWLDRFAASTRLGRYVRGRRYDIVQSAAPDTLGLLALSAARQSRCPMVGAYHTCTEDYAQMRVDSALGRKGSLAGGAAYRATRAWFSYYYGMSDLVVVPSRATAAKVRAYFPDGRTEIGIWGRGVDAEAFHPRNRSRRDGDGEVRAVYVGRISPEKSVDVLVETFASRPHVKLVMVGYGDYAPALRRIMRSRGVNCEFTGRLTGADLGRAYADGDMLVFPSRTETFGQVIQEAMASGLPVVVSDRGASPELVEEGRTGFVAPDAAAFGEAVDRLASDEGLRRRMGRAAREFAAARTWRGVTLDLLEQVHGKARRAYAARA
jgi:glycosyltransferase involved in cell wall biosynthesis